MVDQFLKNIGQTSLFNAFRSFKSKCAVLLILLFTISCTDQGCIEADDFGEYEYQVLKVKANGAAQSCVYDYSLAIDDERQGSGLREDLTTGSITIQDLEGTSHTNDGVSGCSFFEDNEELKSICIDYIVQQCQIRNNASGGKADPGWLSTDERDPSQNYGITIYPDSEIEIKAVGIITLGNEANYPSHFVSPKQLLPHAHPEDWRDVTDSHWQDLFFDVKSGQTLSLKFSGQWANGSGDNIGGGPIQITGDSIADRPIYEAAKRTIAYLRPLPAGYEFDDTQATEAAGTMGTPLQPSPDLWQCSYPSGNPNQPTCDNKDYSTIYTHPDFTSEDNDFAKSFYPVTADGPSSVLGYHGGIIRWKDDGILDSNVDPFASGTPNGIAEGGRLLYDASSGVTITNSLTSAYKVYFKSTDTACNIPITVSIQEGGVNTDSYPSRPYATDNITLTNSWNNNYDLALEPGQDLVIAPISTVDSGGVANCGESIQMRFIKYHEITALQSGLVSFTMLNGVSGSQTCRISGSIINPNGSHFNETIGTTTLESDFYEYDPLLNVIPLLQGLDVYASLSTNSRHTWTDPIFVRKGQKIRFNPESWTGTWVEEGGQTVNCGIGMAMKIEPRPALLCRGESTGYVDNPQCTLDYESGELVGCVADSDSCYDDVSPTNYCPNICQADISCTVGSAPDYKKTSCTTGTFPPGDQVDGCQYVAASVDNPEVSYATCSACAQAQITQAHKAAKLNQTTSQCYNLENYHGKVKNIDSGTGIGLNDTTIDDDDIAKGAARLGNFNGSFGNLDGFSDNDEIDSNNANNIVYQVNAPLIFSQDGRLQFFVLDGEDFTNISGTYGNNSAANTTYSGANGIRIDLSGPLEFVNGEMMSARLCSVDSGGVCTGNSDPTALEPKIIEYSDSSTSPIAAESNYTYLNSGTLLRDTLPDSAVDCSHQVVTKGTSSFYCHIGPIIGGANKDYRLTFKIIDPEPTDCDLSTDSVTGTITRGITQENPYYDKDTSGAPGAYCDLSSEEPISPAITTGYTTCVKQFYCASKYINNSGQYDVTIKVKKPDSSNISNVIGGVVNPVVEVLDGPADGSEPSQAQRIYSLLIADGNYQLILSVALALMISFFGLATLMGVSEITHAELLNRLIKIGIIYLFVSPGGWVYFDKLFVEFFKDGTDHLAFLMASSFDSSESVAHAIENNDYYDKAILFESVDRVFGMFFSDAVQKKISALLFADIFGVVYLWIIYLSFMLYVYAVCNAVLLYLTAQVFITLLFIIAPLFFIFLLFGQTKDMFDNWLKQLISFSLQQIFLLTTLAFFNLMMYEVLKMSLGYKVCWDVVWTIKIFGPVIELMSFWTIPSESSLSNGQFGNPSSNVPSLFTILFIWVVASLMNKFITFMTDVAASISGGIKASELGAGVAQAFGEARNYAKSRTSDIYKGTVGKQVERLDMKLFDSGKLASDARRKRREQHTKDEKNKGAMRDAGNKAVEDYKKENAAQLAGKSPEDQRKELDQVKDEAIKSKGKELGLNEAEIAKLRQQKGSTYEGSNAFGLALHTARQGFSSGGTLTRSMDEEKTKTSFSKDQAHSATKDKRMDNKQREEFAKAVKSGNIKVERSTFGKMKGALGSVKHSAQRGTMAQDAFNSMKDAPGAALKSTKEARDYVASAMGGGTYRRAEKELMKEGLISKTSRATSFARTDEEKEAIRQRMAENRSLTEVTNKDGQKQTISMAAYRKAERQLEKEGKLDGHKSFEERQDNPEQMQQILDRMQENQKASSTVDHRAAASVQRKTDKRNLKQDIQKAKENAQTLEVSRQEAVKAVESATSPEEKASAQERATELAKQTTAATQHAETLQKEYNENYSRKTFRDRNGGSTFRRTDKKEQKRAIRDEMLKEDYDRRKSDSVRDSGIEGAASFSQERQDSGVANDEVNQGNVNNPIEETKENLKTTVATTIETKQQEILDNKNAYNKANKEQRSATMRAIGAGIASVATFGMFKTITKKGKKALSDRQEATKNKKAAKQNISTLQREQKGLQKQQEGIAEFERFDAFEKAHTTRYSEAVAEAENLRTNIERKKQEDVPDTEHIAELEEDLAHQEGIVKAFDKAYASNKTSTKGKRLDPKQFDAIMSKAQKEKEAITSQRQKRREASSEEQVERGNDATNQPKKSRFSLPSFSFGFGRKKKEDEVSLLDNEGGGDDDDR